MTACAGEVSAVAVVLVVAAAATGARGQFAVEGGSVVVAPARALEAGRARLELPAAGTWQAWAWQKVGRAVAWRLGERDVPAATAEGRDGTFAWVSLGPVQAGAGAVAVACRPKAGRVVESVGAVLLARAAGFDPSPLWRLGRVFPDSVASAADARLARCRHLNQRMAPPRYATRQAWEARAAWLREHIRAACGLLPAPPRTPLKPRIFGRIERDGYTIEKAFIETHPGFYSTGNLYRPRGRKGPFPGIAAPHGHGRRGRLETSVQSRCITQAKLGYVVFSYDMVGYNDSAKQNGPHRSLFTGRDDELWGLSNMALQTWNTLRAIDLLGSLPDVDANRIGVTGCSGGGTQTFMVMGIDPRVTAAAPVCMVSGIMQGGCLCENAPLLRIETNNIEIAALMAPRPLMIPSVTGDWTRETPKVEYPAIRGIYALYGAADRVANPHIVSGHGYPKPHRESVYGFFERWLAGRGDGAPIPEPPIRTEKAEDLLVWAGRDLPADAKSPAALKAYLIADCRRQRDALLPKRPADRERFAATLGAAYRHCVLAALPKPGQVAAEPRGEATVGGVHVTRLLLGRKGIGDRIPAVLYRPKGAPTAGRACVVVHPGGKMGLLDAARGEPGPLLGRLLAAGRSVLAPDVYLTGEFLSPVAPVAQKREGKYFTTYNRTVLVRRVQDILTAVAYVSRRRSVEAVDVVGVGSAGAWCLLAGPFLPGGSAVAADLAGLGGEDDPRWADDLFTPLILKAGDARTAAALTAPRRLLLHAPGAGFDAAAVRAAYAAADARRSLRIERHGLGPQAVVRWLTE